MNRKLAASVAAVLVVIVGVSLFFTVGLPPNKSDARPFYVGVEYGYTENKTAQVQVAELQALVDKVKDYTNLLIVSAVSLTGNSTALDQECSYIYNAKLNFIVQFTGSDKYDYDVFAWMQQAKQKYGSQFLGIYRFDEPGGNQLDQAAFLLVNKSDITATSTYSDVANSYVGSLSLIINYYLSHAPIQVFTSDYGLYWFDYQANYSCIFAEFVYNESQARHIALCRGAANSFGKDWGVIVTWKYTQPPYLESADELYSDLALAYSAGAKYAVVFSYPDVTDYGTLTEEHFAALQKFWTTLHSNPASFGEKSAQVAYVVPKDYGFDFRSPNGFIWGLFPADALTPKIYDDTNTLTAKYDSRLNILYDEPELTAPTLGNYSQVYYWNQTIQ